MAGGAVHLLLRGGAFREGGRLSDQMIADRSATECAVSSWVRHLVTPLREQSYEFAIYLALDLGFTLFGRMRILVLG